jgi:hypothetical protein
MTWAWDSAKYYKMFLYDKYITYHSREISLRGLKTSKKLAEIGHTKKAKSKASAIILVVKKLLGSRLKNSL